ncbi:MAG: DUF1501 domain-containing protein [Planctomycetaceae bacterium]|nr:DUF1501 domain-containing protein [Planctomycetaceae bacterium]
MNPILEHEALLNRRHFFGSAASGVGTAALASLLAADEKLTFAATGEAAAKAAVAGKPKAKRVIYLFQSGAPSQLDLFDYKPTLRRFAGQDLPASVRMGQRLTGMTSGQSKFPIAPSIFKFAQHGKSGAWLSELLPHLAGTVDDMCIVRTMHTEAINHDPAITFSNTGGQIAGRPSIGAWTSYGLGTENSDLPAFVVMISTGTGRPTDQPLYDRLWGSGFLPTRHQGVKFRSVGDPVLYLSNPPGVAEADRRGQLDDLAALNAMNFRKFGDPEINTRIAQYELAYRMQSSVPQLTDVSDETEETFEMYGPNSRKPGTFAANCLLARRLAERGVRFIQLFHKGWDQHSTLPKQLRGQCSDTDQPSAALLKDLKRRGLLDETLVVWGGEFGRTVYCQGTLTADNYGRDHHPRCYTVWLAGGGVRGGLTYGTTDEHSYNIVERPVHVHDLNATILHQLGINHLKLTYRFQGRDFRLTDVGGNVMKDWLA